jgi:cysteine desulfurase / selenocysteine lyase
VTAHSALDVSRARSETPGCETVLHFNNAGAALMPQRVVDAMISHLLLESQIGGYEAFEHSHQAAEDFYRNAARLLGCDPEEIAFIENATRAWDMAFYSLKFKPGDRILTSQSEYASNFLAFLQITRKTGAVIDIVPNDEFGQISVTALEKQIDDRVKLIALTHVPTNGGLINPAAEVGRIAKKHGVVYLLDACQSVGQLPVNVHEIGCDLLSATGRKFLRGPRATGILYARKSLIENLEPPFVDLHAATWTAPDQFTIRKDARRFENWEQNYAGKIGLATAIQYGMEWGLHNIRSRINLLAGQLRQRLADLPAVTVRDLGREKSGIVTFSIEGKTPDEIHTTLAAQKINVSVSRQSSTLLDMRSRGLADLVRASVHYYNTEEEVDRFCQAVGAAI